MIEFDFFEVPDIEPFGTPIGISPALEVLRRAKGSVNDPLAPRFGLSADADKAEPPTGRSVAVPMPLCSIPAPLCGTCETWWTANKERKVGEVIGEMFGRDNQGITESDVLAAAKRAGVY